MSFCPIGNQLVTYTRQPLQAALLESSPLSNFVEGPSNVVRYAQEYSDWLSGSDDLPKLYVHAEPGFFSDAIKERTRDWPNQRTVTVKGIHFIQEDSPDEIGEAIRDFLTNDVFK